MWKYDKARNILKLDINIIAQALYSQYSLQTQNIYIELRLDLPE